MTERRRNVLVGAFMVTGLGALGVLMVMFGEAPEWIGGAEWKLRISVTQLRAAPQGTPVRLNGVQIGRVEKLEFDDPARPDRGVSVIVLVKDHYDVPQLARAIIYDPALGIGRGHIEVSVPEGGGGDPLPRSGGVIRGEMGSMFNEIVPNTLMSGVEQTVLKVGALAEALTPAAKDLHHLLRVSPVDLVDDPDRSGASEANFHTVIQRVDLTLKNVNDFLGDAEVQQKLHESISNLHQMTEDGRLAFADLREAATTIKGESVRIANKVEQGLDRVTADADELTRKAAPVLDNTAELMGNLGRASRDLADGQGTAGKLLRDDRLYEKLVLLADRLTEVVETIGRVAAKTERQGFIDLKAHDKVPLVPVHVRQTLYDPAALEESNP